MTRREKIERWEEEIVRLDAAQKEMAKKTQEKIALLRKKLIEERRMLEIEDNEKIASIVRSVYGELEDPDKLREILGAFDAQPKGDDADAGVQDDGAFPTVDDGWVQ